MSILCIGLPLDTFDCIASTTEDNVKAAVSVKDASDMLSKSEYSKILLDPTGLSSPTDVLNNLLSHTPLTTNIILLCNDLDGLALTEEELSEMGVRWARTPDEAGEMILAKSR